MLISELGVYGVFNSNPSKQAVIIIYSAWLSCKRQWKDVDNNDNDDDADDDENYDDGDEYDDHDHDDLPQLIWSS